MFNSNKCIFSGFRLAALSATTLLMAACQTAQVQAPAVSANTAAAALASAPLLRQDAFNGIYEVAATADGGALFVATISGFDPQNGGTIHRLDARALQTVQSVHVPRRSFALGLNGVTDTLYVGNTMEGITLGGGCGQRLRQGSDSTGACAERRKG